MTDNTLRDDKGRWIKGTPATNPAGRPSLVVERDLLDQFRSFFLGSAPGKDMSRYHEVMDATYKQALRGNAQSARLINEYLLGKPSQSIDIQGQLQSIIVSYVTKTSRD